MWVYLRKEYGIFAVNQEKDRIMNVNLALNENEFFKEYGRPKSISMYTLGCKVNQYDTEALIDGFAKSLWTLNEQCHCLVDREVFLWTLKLQTPLLV